jgi:hypothetical protein
MPSLGVVAASRTKGGLWGLNQASWCKRGNGRSDHRVPPPSVESWMVEWPFLALDSRVRSFVSDSSARRHSLCSSSIQSSTHYQLASTLDGHIGSVFIELGPCCRYEFPPLPRPGIRLLEIFIPTIATNLAINIPTDHYQRLEHMASSMDTGNEGRFCHCASPHRSNRSRCGLLSSDCATDARQSRGRRSMSI